MSIFTDIKEIRSGIRKGNRDIAKIKLYEAEHEAKHKADPDYECVENTRVFYASLANDLGPEMERFAYHRVAQAYRDSKIELRSIPIQFSADDIREIVESGGEIPEGLLRRAREAIENEAAFQEQVSETSTKKKWGKR